MDIPKLNRILLVEDSYHIRALINMTLTVLKQEALITERDAFRITALILGLIIIIEKACEDSETPERLQGSISFTKKDYEQLLKSR